MQRLASTFKGVHASDFLHYLLRNRATRLTEIATEALSGEGSFGELSEEVQSVIDSDTISDDDTRKMFESVTKWPHAFCEALTTAFDHAKLADMMGSEHVSNAIAAKCGLEEDVVHDVVLLSRFHTQKKREQPSLDHAIDLICTAIHLVLSKIPVAHAYKLEDIAFAVSPATLAKASPGFKYPAHIVKGLVGGTIGGAEFNGVLNDYMHEYSQRVYGLFVGYIPAYSFLSTDSKAGGSYIASHNMVTIRGELNVETIAHEVGHALWNYAYSTRTLTTFLLNTSVKAGTRAKSARDFVNNFVQALEGIEFNEDLRNTLAADLVRGWGADYAGSFKNTNEQRTLNRVIKTKTTQKLLRVAVKKADHSSLLTAWGEAWAEGFAETLLPGYKSPMIKVPGVVFSLINQLLVLGTNHAE